jgi:hypothetical protein
MPCDYCNLVTGHRPGCRLEPNLEALDAAEFEWLMEITHARRVTSSDEAHMAAAAARLWHEEHVGLAVKLLATTDTTPLDAFGTAAIKGTGHSIIRVRDRHYVAVADGTSSARSSAASSPHRSTRTTATGATSSSSTAQASSTSRSSWT